MPESSSTWASANTDLRETVQRLLGRSFRRLRARPHAYRTSNPLTELAVEFAGGERLRLLLKDVSGPHPAMPPFLDDPTREGEVYRSILAPAGIGPRLYGVDGAFILLEDVDGAALWQLDHEAWVRTAGWLAAMHRRLASHAGGASLLRLDRRFYARWPARVRLDAKLARTYDRAVERLLALPVTVIHDELYPANVLVAGERIVPVDWELAAAGPAVLDLAALVTGWDGKRASEILAAYGAVDCRDLAAARLHLAVRWLGWSRDWTPPSEHARDWRAEAAAAAEILLR